MVTADSSSTDIAVVGAGAAGLMAAIAAARRLEGTGRRVLLIDGRARIGAKILMSGGTRCNVTHRRVDTSDFNGGPSHFVRHVLEAHRPSESVAFFKEIGVDLVLEPGGKLFPATHSAKTVLHALTGEADRRGAATLYGVKITGVTPSDGGFVLSGKTITGEAREIRARRVILATGGLSHPDTGSDGTGLKIVEGLGHGIVSTSPALSPFVSADREWAELAGIGVDAKLTLCLGGRKAKEIEGPFLFTHSGFSGPAVLDMSRHFVRAAASESPEVRASFLPGENEAGLKARIERAVKESPAKTVKGFADREFGLPARLVETLLRKAGVPGELVLSRFSTEGRKQLARFVLDCPLGVTGVIGYAKAEVTAGGVDLGEVRSSTMESRLVPGLYLAGEILDVDGRIGGFNFQWSWSTGAIAGRAAADSVEKINPV